VSEEKKSHSQIVEEHFNNQPDFFPGPAEKAVFLTGLLTDALLDAQKKKRNAKSKNDSPFRKHLRGLKLSHQYLTEKLFPKLIDSLSYWSDYDYSGLKECTVKYWQMCPAPFPLSSNKVSFIFTVGLHSGLLYAKRTNNEGNNKTEDSNE
jgi:hypothetical protein